MADEALTGREEESKYCFFIYLFTLPSGGGSVPFAHLCKYAPTRGYPYPRLNTALDEMIQNSNFCKFVFKVIEFETF